MARKQTPSAHVMVDLETLGVNPYAPIMSLALVEFDPWGKGSGSEFVAGVTLESALKYGRIDASTLTWWFSAERDVARAAWMDLEQEDLENVLFGVIEWFRVLNQHGVCVWGNGATFDNVILSSAFTATGYDKPWGYGSDRCFRTLKNLSKVKPPKFEGTEHDPLHDARHQVAWLQKIVKHEGLKVL